MKFVDAQGGIYYPKNYLTFRDILLKPQYSKISSRSDSHINIRGKIARDFGVSIPVVSANMDTVTESEMAIVMHQEGGLGILHRFYNDSERHKEDIKKVYASTNEVAISVGIQTDWDIIDFAMENANEEVLICLDVAHGHLKKALDSISEIRRRYESASILAGNIATAQGAIDIVNAGADGVKCGVGSGSICTTRIVTGHGVPMITAIMQVREALDSIDSNYGIVADGGIRETGDIVKALAAGANAVMCGSIFAGTDESPSEKIKLNGKTMCQYRGQASRSFLDDIGREGVTPEGIKVDVSYKGSVIDILQDISGGIRSGLSYSGVTNINDLQLNAEAIEISHHGWVESTAHVSC